MAILNYIELLQNKNKDRQHCFYIPAYTKYKKLSCNMTFLLLKTSICETLITTQYTKEII